MKKIAIILSCLFLSGCLATNQEKGRLIGGVLGGVIHASNTPLSLLGVIAGAWVGGELGEYVDDQEKLAHQSEVPPFCNKYYNEGERKSCIEGFERKKTHLQKKAEKDAFKVGYEYQ